MSRVHPKRKLPSKKKRTKTDSAITVAIISGSLALLGVILAPIVTNYSDRIKLQFVLSLTPPTPAQSVAAPVTSTPPAPTPTPTPTPAAVISDTGVHTFKPSPADLSSLDNIWSFVSFRDIRIPGTENYLIRINSTDTYLWNFGQCAKEAKQLLVILSAFKLVFSTNGIPVPDPDLYQYDLTTKDGWSCSYWATKLSGWTSGAQVKLDVLYTYDTKIYDGIHFYSPGEYRQIIDVTVK